MTTISNGSDHYSGEYGLVKARSAPYIFYTAFVRPLLQRYSLHYFDLPKRFQMIWSVKVLELLSVSVFKKF